MPEPDSSWLAWIIAIPLIAGVLGFVAGPRAARGLALAGALVTVAVALGTMWQLMRHGTVRHPVGGWAAPLGIELFADGMSAVMLVMAAAVFSAAIVYAVGYYSASDPSHRPVGGASFFPIVLFAWAALNALFLSSDIFNLYVTIELLTLASVALIVLAGGATVVAAALRYLLAALLGSLAYLLGVTLLYAAYETVDVTRLGEAIQPGPVAWWAAALMMSGLLLKTALFPLHFWLPAAHAGAPAPVSALLSALVVKASFYIVLRLWFWVFAEVLAAPAGTALGVLGAAAIIWGSVQALRQKRLKLLVAYSTVAQIGYLFLVFALAVDGEVMPLALSGVVYLALSHACAKGAMFFVSGAVIRAIGHDRLDGLGGVARNLPISVFGFALAGVSLIGLPPSGGFIAKWLLLHAAIRSERWWLAAVLLGGSLLTAGYVFRPLAQLLAARTAPDVRPVPRLMEGPSLALALIVIVLGVMATPFMGLLEPVARAAAAQIAGAVP